MKSEVEVEFAKAESIFHKIFSWSKKNAGENNLWSRSTKLIHLDFERCLDGVYMSVCLLLDYNGKLLTHGSV